MGTKRCPFCAEKIQSKAVKCRFCGSSLSGQVSGLTTIGAEQPRQQKKGRRASRLTLIVVAAVLFLFFRHEWRKLNTTPQRSVRRSRVEANTPAIPTDVVYSIIDSSVMPGIKRSLDVRLNRKVSEAALREIAVTLKARDPQSYERTFIGYYLPDMKVGSYAWATTHFNPNLEVKVLGLTVEEEAMLRQLSDDPSRTVIGNWLDETPFMGKRISIFWQDNKLFMEDTHPDGSSGKKEMTEKPWKGGKTFERKEGSRGGEYYLIDVVGNLQLWDREGLVLTAKKISPAMGEKEMTESTQGR